MFLAVRDLRFARGRFALMGAVIALLSLLVVLLSGLTAGLGAESVSAIRSLPADQLAVAAPAAGESASFSSSRLSLSQVEALRRQRGVSAAAPLGIASARLEANGQQVAVTAFGVDPQGFLRPSGLTPTTVVVDQALADDNGITAGDTVRVGGQTFTVAGTRTDSSYSHTPVVWLPLTAWQQLDAANGAAATAVALRSTSALDAGTAGTESGTVVRDRDAMFSAIGSYSAENGSLTLMRLLLLAVGALVVGAFFTVWTIQRTPDLAVLKAIGASTRYLVRDAAAQTLALLVLGGAVGTGVAVTVGLLAARVVPFAVTPATTVVPLGTLLAVGLVGGLAAVRRIATVDPLTALGAAR